MTERFPRQVPDYARWIQVSDWAYEHESKLFRISRSLSFAESKNGAWVYDAWYGKSSAESPAPAITERSLNSFDAAVKAVTAYAKELKSSQPSTASTSTTKGATQS